MTLATPPHALHVSPVGDDANAGSAERPFRTVAAAVAAARALPADRPRHVLLQGGDYFDTQLKLDDRDSGLTLEAAPGQEPVLYGGRAITGFRPLDDKIWAADLPAPAAGQPAWDFRMLLVDGRFAPRARLPKQGHFTHETTFPVRWMSTTGGGWERKPTPEELTTLRYRAGDLGPWLDIKSAEITVFHSWDESVVGLASHDPATRTLRFANPAGHPPGAFGNQRYVVWNTPEGLTEPGQWCLDRTRNRLLYWPLPNQAMARAVVLAPTAESVILIEGSAEKPVRNLTLRNLGVRLTSTPMIAGGFGAGAFPGAITATHLQHSLLERLHIWGVGGQAIKLNHALHSVVDRAHLHDCGAGGIWSNGSNNARFTNSRIHHVGLTYPSAIALRCGGNDALVAHNHFHHTPYTAVNGAGRGLLIENNLFEHVMETLDDGAAIYIGFGTDLVVRGNVTRHVRSGVAQAYYIDEQGERCVVERNLSIDVAWPLHNHMARNCTIRHNLCISPSTLRVTFPRCSNMTFEGNVLIAQGAITLDAPPQGLAAAPRNILLSKTGQVMRQTLTPDGYSVTQKGPFEPGEGTLLADPLLEPDPLRVAEAKPGAPGIAGAAGAAGGEPALPAFRFKHDSPGLRLGLPQFDWSNVGPLPEGRP